MAAFITVSVVEQDTPGVQASHSYLLIQQLFILSGITKQDVRQFSPDIFVLEVANLREARKQEKDRKVFFTSTTKKNSKESKEKESDCATDVLNTSCLIIPFSSLSWKNLFHGLCNQEGKKDKSTQIITWFIYGLEETTQAIPEVLRVVLQRIDLKNCFRFRQEQGKRSNKSGLDWKQKELEIPPKHQ